MISTTRVSKRAGMDPSAMRLSMSGFTQYLIEAPRVDRDGPASRAHRPETAPARLLPPSSCRRRSPRAAESTRGRRGSSARRGQILAGHTQPVRVVVVSDGKHDGAGAVGSRPASRSCWSRSTRQSPRRSRDQLPDARTRCAGRTSRRRAGNTQRLDSRRFLIGRHQRHAPNLEQLRRREKRHVHGELINRVHQHALSSTV